MNIPAVAPMADDDYASVRPNLKGNGADFLKMMRERIQAPAAESAGTELPVGRNGTPAPADPALFVANDDAGTPVTLESPEIDLVPRGNGAAEVRVPRIDAPEGRDVPALERAMAAFHFALREFFMKMLGFSEDDAGDQAYGASDRLRELFDRQGVTGVLNNARFTATEIRIEVRQLDVRLSRQEGVVAARFQSVSISFRGMQIDPLILDMDGDGVETTTLADGRLFDMAAEGKKRQVAWAGADDAFLALDRNGNGRIDDGGEFFGDQHGARDGIAELAKFDDNGDGAIDESDKVYDALLLVHGDGRERRLADSDITRIFLDATLNLDRRLEGGNLVAASHYEKKDGTTGMVGDVLLDAV